jgi:predicted AlkP superfamily pyrophosphatase or phosphodiesterase
MRNFFHLLSLSLSFLATSQQKPKLVVGIVVDQMRYEYLQRYSDKFSPDGFNRLVNDGFLFKNAHYNYIPTKTGPGHASIFTGSTPSRHGVIGNDWYVNAISKDINCVGDSTELGVGGVESNGNVSPRNMLTTTITDELRLFYNFQSKVIGVSLKDRGASLPAGHNPTGAYWYDLNSGNMMTSTYYMESLPKWVQDFNKRERAKELLNQQWDYFKDPKLYTESIADKNEYEQDLWEGLGTTFPHDLRLVKDEPGLMKYTPFTNTLIAEFAMASVKAEKLGENNITDFLTVSFSATDDIGHKFGPRSVEVQDTYLRLDAELATMLKFLDNEVGKENYVVFLTADHGANDVSAYLVKNKMPGGYHNDSNIRNLLNEGLSKIYGENKWVARIINDQVYLNQSLIKAQKIDLFEIREKAARILENENYISEAFTANKVAERSFTDPFLQMVQNGYNNERSGDVLYILSSGQLGSSYGRVGTDHRTVYTYDTNIPVIFYGAGISKGSSVRRVDITDIAPSLSIIMGIGLPSGASGNPLSELFD